MTNKPIVGVHCGTGLGDLEGKPDEAAPTEASDSPEGWFTLAEATEYYNRYVYDGEAGNQAVKMAVFRALNKHPELSRGTGRARRINPHGFKRTVVDPARLEEFEKLADGGRSTMEERSRVRESGAGVSRATDTTAQHERKQGWTDLLTLEEAAYTLPRPPHMTTIWRWCRKGLNGIRLEYLRIGGRIYVPREALEAFGRARAAADREPSPIPRPRDVVNWTLRRRRSEAERQAAIEEARARLRGDGR